VTHQRTHRQQTQSQDADARRLDAPPWEQRCSMLDGHGVLSDSRGTRAVIEAHGPSCGTGPAHALTDKSGMTRRGVVYEYIRGHPGAHVRGITRELRLATGDLQYHLFWLEKHGFVKTRRAGFYRFVYPTMVFRDEQEVLLGLLTLDTPREILLSLLHDPAITQGGLARILGHSQPTISWHMERLLKTGLVVKNRKRTGGENAYQVVADRDDIVGFVKVYHPDVWKRWASRLSTADAAEGRRVITEGSLRGAGVMQAAVVKLIGSG